jgi:hypothetical protein
MRLPLSVRAAVVAALVVGGLAASGPATAAPAGAADNAVSPDHAGFVVTADAVHAVRARWVQPAATCQQGASYADFRISFSTGSREVAIGSAAECNGGAPILYAWTKFGGKRVRLDETLNSGDTMVGRLTSGPKGISVLIGDQTAGWGEALAGTGMGKPDFTDAFFGVTARTGQSGVLPLTDFGSLKLIDCRVNHQPVQDLSPQLVTMESHSGVVKAEPLKHLGRILSVIFKHA